MSREFAVIGLGRFGGALARSLFENGAEVTGVDIDQDVVNEAKDYTTLALCLDPITHTKALDTELTIPDYESVIIGVAHEQASIMISLLVIERGARNVIAKVQSDLQAEVLHKIGVQQCVFPERDSGRQLATQLLTSSILRSIELSDDYGIAELATTNSWFGQSLIDLNFRQRYGLNIIAIRHADESVNINPQPSDKIHQGDVVLALGSTKDIADIEKKLASRAGL